MVKWKNKCVLYNQWWNIKLSKATNEVEEVETYVLTCSRRLDATILDGVVAVGSLWALTFVPSNCVDTFAEAPIVMWLLTLIDIYEKNS